MTHKLHDAMLWHQAKFPEIPNYPNESYVISIITGL